MYLYFTGVIGLMTAIIGLSWISRITRTLKSTVVCRSNGQWSSRSPMALSVVWGIYMNRIHLWFTATSKFKTFSSATSLWLRWAGVTLYRRHSQDVQMVGAPRGGSMQDFWLGRRWRGRRPRARRGRREVPERWGKWSVGRGALAPPRYGGLGAYPPENLWNLTCKSVHLMHFCACLRRWI